MPNTYHWAKDLSWTAVTKCFRTSWQTVYLSISMFVDYGLTQRIKEGVASLGIDEVQYKNRHT